MSRKEGSVEGLRTTLHTVNALNFAVLAYLSRSLSTQPSSGDRQPRAKHAVLWGLLRLHYML